MASLKLSHSDRIWANFIMHTSLKKGKAIFEKKGRFIIMTHMRYKEETHLWWFCGIKAKNLKNVKKGRFMKQNHRKLKEKNGNFTIKL